MDRQQIALFAFGACSELHSSSERGKPRRLAKWQTPIAKLGRTDFQFGNMKLFGDGFATATLTIDVLLDAAANRSIDRSNVKPLNTLGDISIRLGIVNAMQTRLRHHPLFDFTEMTNVLCLLNHYGKHQTAVVANLPMRFSPASVARRAMDSPGE